MAVKTPQAPTRPDGPPAGPTAEMAQAGRQENLVAAPFLAPALVFYVLFLIVPLFGTVTLSFTAWGGFNWSALEWVWFSNFAEVLRDDVFLRALVNNLFFLFGAVILKTVVALALALALDQNLPLTNFFRGVYLMPTILSMVVVGIVFQLALSPSLGLINPLVEALGLQQFAGGWLGDSTRALPILILIDAWAGFGLYMFLFIARLVSIPQDLRDAAAVDGANQLQSMWHVTLPLLRKTASMVVLLAAIQSLKVFELVLVMTNGGPNHATEVISTWGYFQGFTTNRVGYGSAILVVLLVITFVLAYVQVTRFRAEEDV